MKVLCIKEGERLKGYPMPEVGSIYYVNEVKERTCHCGKCFRMVYYRIDEIDSRLAFPEALFATLPGLDNEGWSNEEPAETDIVLDVQPV